MSLVCRTCFNGLSRFSHYYFKTPILVQIRYRKEWKRKPVWMPTAKSKFYRIPEHPYVSPEEKDLVDELLSEYYIKLNSMRKVIQDEMKQKHQDDSVQKKEEAEVEFHFLLEENKKENERIRVIREETLEKLLQEKKIELLQLEEMRKASEAKTKLKVEELVRREKEKVAGYISYENLEEVIEKAMENEVNFNFSINVHGSLKWEGKPPKYYEEEMKRRMNESFVDN